MSTICQLAKNLIQSAPDWTISDPIFEYTAGEPPDILPLLEALVPEEEERDLLE